MTKTYFISSINKRLCKQSKTLLFILSGFFVLFIFFIIIGSVPQIMKISASAPGYDCDDATLQAYNFFTDIGIKSKIIAGDLNRTAVPISEINHVWLIAELGPIEMAFDWGRPCLDSPHYRGYEINCEQLVQWVIQDKSLSN